MRLEPDGLTRSSIPQARVIGGKPFGKPLTRNGNTIPCHGERIPVQKMPRYRPGVELVVVRRERDRCQQAYEYYPCFCEACHLQMLKRTAGLPKRFCQE